MRRVFVALIAGSALALMLAACAAADDRTVAVRMFDDMRYDPAEFSFTAGQTVRFEVTNEGAVRHEFFIGDIEAHEDHAADMRDTGHADQAHETATGVTVEPGETEVLELTFSEPAELFVGCHEPGHYEAGMVAPIVVH